VSAASLRSTPKNAPIPAISVAVIERLEPAVHRLVARALRALEDSAVYRGAPLSSPELVRAHLRFRLAHLDHEQIHVLWLDVQNRLITADVVATGTLAAAQVYPRELVKAGLAHNAGACILAHNHPSGEAIPSRADEDLTRSISAALATVDIKLLDHFIVAGAGKAFSFAEGGLL